MKILFKDNKIECCSQTCASTCKNFDKCRIYTIDVRRFKERKERLSFNFIEKLMSERADVDERKCRGR